MNWLDIVLGIVFALSTLGGLLKGFARVGIGFLATLTALFCGIWFYGTAGYYFLPYVSHKGIANFLGFLAVFLVIVLLGAVVGKILSLLFKWAGLGWLDRLLGAAFGMLRALVFAVALVLALMAFAPTPPPQSVVHSRFAPYVIGTARFCAGIAPHDVRENVRENYEKVKRIWSEMVNKGQQKPRDSSF